MMQQKECTNCHAINLSFSKGIDYLQCKECDKLIKVENNYSKLDEIIKKNIGLGLFDEVE